MLTLYGSKGSGSASTEAALEIAGLPEIQQLEERYGVPEDQRASL